MSDILINVADIVEANGRTIRQNNLARTHSIPIGTLVELESGARLLVVAHSRDCDGTPLYDLGVAIGEGQLARHYMGESLSIVA